MTPEFWDYDTADAFIKAGRNPDERPTKDAWNTKAVRTASDQISLHVKKPDATWFSIAVFVKGKDTIVDLDASGANFVWAERLNRYVGRSRSLNFVDDMLIGAGPVIVGPVVSRVVLARSRLRSINDNSPAELTSGVPLNDPLPYAVMDKFYIRPQVKMFGKELADNQTIIIGNGWCKTCLPQGPHAQPLGEMMHDREHVFAHLFLGVLPSELVSRAIQLSMGSWAWKETVEVVGTDTVISAKPPTYNARLIETAVRKYLESQVK